MVFFGDNQDQQLRFGERVLRRASPDFNDGINPTGKLLQTMTAPHDNADALLVGKSGGRG